MTINASPEIGTIPQTKAELISRINRSWQKLQESVQRAVEPDLAPGPDEWSVKDHIIHLAYWEGSVLGRLVGLSSLESVGIAEDAVDPHDFDAINALIRARSRGLPFEEAVRESESSHRMLVTALFALPDRTLFVETLADGTSVLASIMCNTYPHYDEHRASIEALTRRLSERD